jgi:hypothetical protein
MRREKRTKYYYTAREAQQHLGLSVDAFYYLVDTGKIKRVLPPGKLQGFYSKHQIERLAKEKLKCMFGEKEPVITLCMHVLPDTAEHHPMLDERRN